MKLNNKAEHMKVKVTQEDTLHSKCSFIKYIINHYCPSALLPSLNYKY